ncbi:hypothetical protein E1B28_013274 [Marasmius oreades]|uniref:Uncharacterized protein n=1 Tax=Marasmius oreades TaxID=181124 RepID=A0A9P7RP99_9AGAR|nr:uncharacterized protein E1B28_013274 [Marasmius oreades]KAG7087296.1 hypothetical protein E1B28_013274 [Marasmius oreades]
MDTTVLRGTRSKDVQRTVSNSLATWYYERHRNVFAYIVFLCVSDRHFHFLPVGRDLLNLFSGENLLGLEREPQKSGWNPWRKHISATPIPDHSRRSLYLLLTWCKSVFAVFEDQWPRALQAFCYWDQLS